MLNQRQNDLLDLLHYQIQMRVADICATLPQHYNLGCANSAHKNTNCGLLYKDIDAINADLSIDSIIVKDKGWIKLATQESAMKYAEKEWKRACHYLVTHSTILRKMKLDGQYDIIKDQFHKIYKGDKL